MLPIELSRGDRELIFSFTLVLLQVSIILVILHAGSLYGWNAVAYESASNHEMFLPRTVLPLALRLLQWHWLA